MSLNKKAVDFGTVGKLIVAILIIALLWVVFVNLGDFLYGTGNKAACQNWVARNSVTGLKEIIGSETGSSACVTTEESIKTSDDNEIYEQLARNMYDCWDQYGRGETDFYSNFDFGSKNTYCRICSEIKIDESIKGKKLDIDKFEIYLSNHNPPNSKQTYAEFFTKTKEAKLDLGEGSLDLEPGKKLYTSFIVYKSSINPETTFAIPKTTEEAVFSTETAFAVGGCILGAKIGGGIGTLFAGVGAVPGAIGGCGFGIIAGQIIRVAGYADYLYPSIILFKESDKKVQEVCNYVYYNPEKKPFSFVNK